MSVKFSVHVITQTRKKLLEIINGLSIEQLNEVPKGFSNNIAWNFGHVIVTLELLCYVNANQTPSIPEDVINKYRRGTKPEEFIDSEELSYLKSLLFSSFDNLENDRNAGLLNRYNAMTSSMGIVLDNIDDAIAYTGDHDNIHLGYVQALRRAVG